MPGAEPPPPPPAPTPELPPERPGVGWTWLVAGLPLGLLAAALDLRVYRQYVAGEVWWKSWEHDAGATWHWVPFIHPPLFTEYMRAFL